MALPVLVVDDSPFARKMLIKALPREWDIEISQASSGAEALEQCRAGKAAVMFLDLNMPGMDGFQLLEAIRREELDSLVIVVSADVQPKARSRVLALGAMAFLAKPVTAEKLLPVLKEYGLHG